MPLVVTHTFDRRYSLGRRPRGDDPQQVQTGLDGEPVDRAVQAGLEHRADHVPRRGVRVQVNGGVQGLGGLEYGPEFSIVEVLPLGVGVDDDTLEAQAARAALDLLRRALRILRGDRGQPAEPVGIPLARFGQPFVGQRGHGDRPVPVEDLGAGTGQRDDLAVDAGCVHVGDPAFAQVLQAGQDGGGTFGLAPDVEAGEAEEAGIIASPLVQHGAPERDQLGRRECLLGGDPEVTRLRVHT